MSTFIWDIIFSVDRFFLLLFLVSIQMYPLESTVFMCECLFHPWTNDINQKKLILMRPTRLRMGLRIYLLSETVLSYLFDKLH